MARFGSSWVMAATITLLCGCAQGATSGAAGSGGATGAGGAPGGSGGAAGASAGGTPTFTRVWNEVLVPKGCTAAACHGAMPGQGNLSLMAIGAGYRQLVNMPAAGDRCGPSGKIRVVPSNPAMSLLVEKLSSASPGCGNTMPPGAGVEPACTVPGVAACNSMAEVQLVKDWIMAGAMND